MNYTLIKAPPINTIQLSDEIVTIGLPAPVSIDSEDVNLTIGFAGSLDEDQQSILSGVVAAHSPTPGYVSLATQAAIATFTGYLNSATPSVANTARAQMILVMAPKLPPDILASVNANIRAIVGF